MKRLLFGLGLILLVQVLVIVLFHYVFHITNVIYIEIAIDFVLAFVFSILNYPGERKDAIKDPLFHRNVAIYFVLLVVFSFIFMFI